MVNLAKHVKSPANLVEDFVEFYATTDKKTGHTRLDVEDIPIDEIELYAKACIHEDDDIECIIECNDLRKDILGIVGRDFGEDLQKDLVESIRSQAIKYYEHQLSEQIESELLDKNSYNADNDRYDVADFMIAKIKEDADMAERGDL